MTKKKDKYLRAVAEIENTRRRAAIDADAAARNRAMSVARHFLPVIDAAYAALSHNPDDEGIITSDGSSNPDDFPTPFISNIAGNSNKPNWLKKAIDFIRKKKILAGILAIIAAAGTFIAIIPYLEKGKFEATINGEALDSSTINRTYLVFFDKESANLMKFKEFPRIFNPSRYSLNDINLK